MTRTLGSRPCTVAMAVTGLLVLVNVCSAQVLETETARLRKKGAVQLGGNFEYQTSSEGQESAVPFVFEYGITDRLEITVEPVFGTRIQPNNGPQASGAGDLEVTTTFLAHREGTWPAIAFAGEVKFPTARNSLIGTGQTDLAGFFIASKRFGRVDTSLNLSYTFVGQPPGVTLGNIVGGALAAMITVSPRFRVYSEFLGVLPASMHESGRRRGYGHEQEEGSWHERVRVGRQDV